MMTRENGSSSPTQPSYWVIALFIAILPINAIADNPASECEDPEYFETRDAVVYSGIAQGELNLYGELVIVLDRIPDPGTFGTRGLASSADVRESGRLEILNDSATTNPIGDGVADLVFRVAVDQRQDLSELYQLLATWDMGPRLSQIIKRSGKHHHELLLRVADDEERLWTISQDYYGCSSRAGDSLNSYANQSIQAIALSVSGIQHQNRSLDAALGDFMQSPLVDREGLKVLKNGASTNALFCLSGGSGSQSCSLDFGTVGPISAGSCSVSCNPGFFACCGPGAPNCQCKPIDSSSGGGGGIADPGGGVGGDEGGGGSTPDTGGGGDECDSTENGEAEGFDGADGCGTTEPAPSPDPEISG